MRESTRFPEAKGAISAHTHTENLVPCAFSSAEEFQVPWVSSGILTVAPRLNRTRVFWRSQFCRTKQVLSMRVVFFAGVFLSLFGLVLKGHSRENTPFWAVPVLRDTRKLGSRVVFFCAPEKREIAHFERTCRQRTGSGLAGFVNRSSLEFPCHPQAWHRRPF